VVLFPLLSAGNQADHR